MHIRAVKPLTFPPEPNLAKRRSPLGSSPRTKFDDYPHLTIGDMSCRATRWTHTSKSACKLRHFLDSNMHKRRPPLQSKRWNKSNMVSIRESEVWKYEVHFEHNRFLARKTRRPTERFSDLRKAYPMYFYPFKSNDKVNFRKKKKKSTCPNSSVKFRTLNRN